MNRPYPRVLLPLASFVVVVAGLKAGATLLLPFLVALFLGALTLPLLLWLRRWLGPWSAVSLAVLADLLVLAAAGALVSRSVRGFLAAVPRYRARLQDLLANTGGWLETRGVPSEWLAFEQIDPSSMLDLVVGAARGVASAFTNVVLVVLVLVFLLLEVERLPARLQAAGVPAERRARYQRALGQVQRYLVIKTLVSVVTGLLIGLGVGAVGLDFPVLWGLLAFVLNYIPNLGSIIAAIPACFLGLVQLGWGPTLLVALIFLTVNVLLGNLLEPQLLGRRLGLSPLVIFTSLIFWGWVWGPVGMLLSVPLTVIVRIFLENSDELRWVVALLAARPPGTVAPSPPLPADRPQGASETEPAAAPEVAAGHPPPSAS